MASRLGLVLVRLRDADGLAGSIACIGSAQPLVQVGIEPSV